MVDRCTDGDFVDRFWKWYDRNRKDLRIVKGSVIVLVIFFGMLWYADHHEIEIEIICATLFIVIMCSNQPKV